MTSIEEKTMADRTTIQIKRLQEEVTPRLQEIQRLQKTVKALGG